MIRPFLVFPAVLALLFLGCNQPDLDVDPELVLGTGETEFLPLEGEGPHELDLAYGVQGGQHLWVALRATGLDWREILVDLRLVDDDGVDVTMASSSEVRMGACPVASEGCRTGWGEVVGLTLVIDDPSLVVGYDLHMSATATDAANDRVAAASTLVLPLYPQ